MPCLEAAIYLARCDYSSIEMKANYQTVAVKMLVKQSSSFIITIKTWGTTLA